MGDVYRRRVGAKRDLSDMDMEELSNLEVKPKPGTPEALGEMSLEELSDVETRPDYTKMGLEELTKVPIENTPAQEATKRGQVLRGRTGPDALDSMKRIAELVGDGTTPEQVEQHFTSALAKGMTPDEVVNKASEGAKQQTIMGYSARQAEARKKYQDAVSRAAAESENESMTQRILRGIGDVAGAYAGRGTSVVSDEIRAARGDKRARAEKSAKDVLDTELSVIGADKEAGDLQDQADMLAERLRSAGVKFPEGSEKRNPKAFVDTYKGVAGKDSSSFDYRVSRDAELDKRHAAERAENQRIAREAEERRQKFQAGENDKNRAAGLQKVQDKPPMQNQSQAASFGKRMEEAESVLSAVKYDPTASTARMDTRLPNEALSPDAQKYFAAKRAFINSQLRDESGASISPTEFDSAEMQYFPQPGEGPDIVEQKRRMRAIAIQAMRDEAGKAWGGAAPAQDGGSAVYSVPGMGEIDLGPGEIAEFLKQYPNATKVR